MGLVLFFVLSVAVAAILVYPLLPGRTAAAAETVADSRTWTDSRIESAVQRLRESRQQGGLTCPECGRAYQAGDAFCVRCGHRLATEEAAEGKVCPSCGAHLGVDDVFCSRCGHHLATEEVA